MPIVWRSEWDSLALFVSAFMERYISASKLSWRKYGDRRKPADRYATKAEEQLEADSWMRPLTLDL